MRTRVENSKEVFVSKVASTPVPTTTSGYSLGRPQGKCSICNRDIAPGDKFFAAVREAPVGLERLDISADCWAAFDRASLLAFWQTTMPAANAKKKTFVDDALLCDLFDRLGDASTTEGNPAKLNFRFVLGLILMRKRLLIYESTRTTGSDEIWAVRLKGREQTIDLVNPRLDDQQIAEVSGQLGEILTGELE
jgi:hypothetical protein